MSDPYNTAKPKRDPYQFERVKRDRSRNPRARLRQEVIVVDRRGKKVVVTRTKNPFDLMTALNAAGDLAMVSEYLKEEKSGMFKPKKRTKNPVPKHLRKYCFKRVR